MLRMLSTLFLGGCCFSLAVFADFPYKVEYVGIEDPVALKTIRSISQLTTLQKNPPDSLYALKYRAESDIPEILKVLHSRGYYEASVQVEILPGEGQPRVQVRVFLGPSYRIGTFDVSLQTQPQDKVFACPTFHKDLLGLKIGERIFAIDVINAEMKALQQLSNCGYPLASVSDRSVIIDGDTKSARIDLVIDTGPLCYFGSTTIQGNASLLPRFFLERLSWKEGERYSGNLLEETQKKLMDTGLFSSLLITHPKTPSTEGFLPLHIEVTESKQRSIFGGVSYQTYYGPGLTFGWEHRNLGYMGNSISLQGDITRRSHSGQGIFTIPYFLVPDQDYVAQAQAIHLDIFPYLQRSYVLGNRLERRFWKKMRLSFGLEGERLFVNDSVQNGDYWIGSSPFFLGINGANDLLDPTQGYNFEYSMTPTFVASPGRHVFLTQKFGVSYYLPLNASHSISLAQRISGGYIMDNKQSDIPMTKRFYGGSEEEMRGYSYYSVSPLTKSNKPIGGRSALYYTLEVRLRPTKALGLVPFFDTGSVSSTKVLPLKGEWLNSVGLGVRYFSFIGPFRLDVGFPLNPRKGLDKRYKILISIGQSF